MQNYFRKRFFAEIVLQIKRPFQDQFCFSVVIHVQLCKHSPYNLKTASNKIGSIKHVVLTPDFPKYITRSFQRNNISQSKRNLPDFIQKCADELI